MKKLVPDPPPTPFFSIQSHLLPADALAHASELLRGISETLDEHCRLHAGEPGLNMLANATHSTDMARALVEHALARLDAAQGGRMSELTNTFTTVGSETCLEMFRVQPGIPMERVLGEIAVLLGCIRHLSTEAEMEGDLLAGSAARILSDMAKALANDLERGMNRAGR